MQENTKILIDRIDSLTKLCDNDKFGDAYAKIVFEVEQLCIAIAGNESLEYEEFSSIVNSRIAGSTQVAYLRGVLGALRNRIVIEGIKTTNTFNWDNLLHPIVYKTSFKKLLDGYYSDAVDSAIKEMNFKAKNLYKKYKGKELDGADLFANIFNNDKDKTLLMAGGKLESQSNKDEQEGYRFLFMGLWKGLRNPNAHTNMSITKQQAIERLIFISMLMYKFEECIKNSGLIE
ncbi:MAG: TIGR02391 family protein [Clostridia bacterium]|nr:TIGR02391 family protein [Clostridia bacterium]